MFRKKKHVDLTKLCLCLCAHNRYTMVHLDVERHALAVSFCGSAWIAVEEHPADAGVDLRSTGSDGVG